MSQGIGGSGWRPVPHTMMQGQFRLVDSHKHFIDSFRVTSAVRSESIAAIAAAASTRPSPSTPTSVTSAPPSSSQASGCSVAGSHSCSSRSPSEAAVTCNSRRTSSFRAKSEPGGSPACSRYLTQWSISTRCISSFAGNCSLETPVAA